MWYLAAKEYPYAMDRRQFVRDSALSSMGMLTSMGVRSTADGVTVELPRKRVPVSYIIDDSTALVNLAYYGIPQFAEVFPMQYLQDWRSLSTEIPDEFVIEFMEWCQLHGVRGKYSMVPYPACTGWLHRFIPGWTRKELEASLALVRDHVTPDWDIHSEMISHTRVIDIRTGVPFPQATPDYMENWEWSQERTADELGEYIAYSLQVLRDAGFYCDGVTTPGGFGHRNVSNLALGTAYAAQEVFGARVAHFFRDVIEERDRSVQPQVLHVQENADGYATCSVHIIACTGDWFGSWDGLEVSQPDRYITPDLQGGRLVEVIDSGEPAIFICHWPGMYCNGDKSGFEAFKKVVLRLHEKYNNLLWMKLSDIAHYWAAREHTRFTVIEGGVKMHAPFEAGNFTLTLARQLANPYIKSVSGGEILLKRVSHVSQLTEGTWCPDGAGTCVCMALERGETLLLDRN